jgi:hypothetical protein
MISSDKKKAYFHHLLQPSRFDETTFFIAIIYSQIIVQAPLAQ